MNRRVAIRRVRDGVIALAVGFGVATAAMAANDLRGDRSGELLGTPNFVDYCRIAYDATAYNAAGDATGWTCVLTWPTTQMEAIDISEACTTLFGVPAVGVPGNLALQDSWTCVRR